MLRTVLLVAIAIALLGATQTGRASRPLPSALAKKTLRVMTYNIHVGIGMDKKLNLQRIADVINHEHPDLAGLQEVDRGVQRTQRIDEIAEIARLTQMEYAFAYNLQFQGGQYGVAILSRFPIKVIDHWRFANVREKERRGMIRAEIEVHGQTINFVTTHLDYQYQDGRVFEAEQLLKLLAGIKGPVIVAGDFNDLPGADAYKIMTNQFRDAWIESKAIGEGLSYPADKPAKRIDYIFYRPDDSMRATRAWIVNTQASDHLPLVTDLEIRAVP
ncbi:MAG: endonuclease/exonuclease/phosphatase family protein [Pyrinomonadaceae bacterium]